MGRERLFEIAGRNIWGKICRDHMRRGWYWWLTFEFHTKEDLKNFPWEKLPDDGYRFEGDPFRGYIKHPDGLAGGNSFSEIRKEAEKIIWDYEHPVAAEIRELEDDRFFHEQRIGEWRKKRDEGQAFVLNLYWNRQKESWQASRNEGDYRVVYTVNERNPSPNRRKAGQWYCKYRQARVVENHPKNGRRGFLLHVVDPMCRVYDTDAEIARLMPRSEVENPLQK